MIAAARASPTPGSTSRSATCADWRPAEPVDVLVSNATLQWVPGHLDLLPGLVAAVAPGGWLAFQVPGNFDEPSHTIRAELAAEPPYAEHTGGVAVPYAHDPADVPRGADRPRLRGRRVGDDLPARAAPATDPVFTWVSGTGARPTLQALPDDLRAGVRGGVQGAGCARRTRRPTARVVLPFRRVFVVARTAR